jgi:hypothetical protein
MMALLTSACAGTSPVPASSSAVARVDYLRSASKPDELTPAGKVLDTKVVDKSKTQGIFGLVARGSNDNDTVLFFSDRNGNNVQEPER